MNQKAKNKSLYQKDILNHEDIRELFLANGLDIPHSVTFKTGILDKKGSIKMEAYDKNGRLIQSLPIPPGAIEAFNETKMRNQERHF